MAFLDQKPQPRSYVLTERIGSGAYGNVYKAYKKTASRDAVAVKCISRGKLKKRETDIVITEISMMKKLKHEFIVELKDFEWDANYIYLIMEYCGNGDLSRFIRAHKVLPEHVCRRFLRQLAAALKYLREQNISHMDLKPQNILLQGQVLKLADFGFAEHFEDEAFKTSIRGSPLYMAPEMILEHRYDAKADLWSVGVILFECLFGKAPFKSDTIAELLRKVEDDSPVVIPRGGRISSHCYDLLSRCLQRNPTDRISFDDFFLHPFLDLEHMPCSASRTKFASLIAQAVSMDSAGRLEESLSLYQSALEYLVPLCQAESNTATKSALMKKAHDYIRRAEQIKQQLAHQTGVGKDVVPPESKSGVTLQRSPSDEGPEPTQLEQLVHLSKATPAMRTALEIAQSAELYEKEGRHPVALERYQQSLGLLLPLLQSEPKGLRKVMLESEIKRWMSRAETLQNLISVQEAVLEGYMDISASSHEDKTSCVLN